MAGCTGLFGKCLTVSPLVIIAGRTGFGCLSLLLAMLLMGSRLRPQVWSDLWRFALAGAVLAAHWFSFFRAIQVSTVAIGLLAFSSFPLFVTCLEPLLFKERMRAFDVGTGVVVTVGLLVLTPAFSLSNNVTQGVAWGVLSGFLYAILALLNRSAGHAYPAMTVTFYQLAFAALFTLPTLLLVRTTITPRSLWLLLALGVVFTALLQTLFVASLRHIRAQLVSVVMGLEPVYGIFLALIFLGEVPTLRTLLGGALIGGAVLGATRQHLKAAGAPGVL